MKSKVALVLGYLKDNKNSINVIVGCLEDSNVNIDVYLYYSSKLSPNLVYQALKVKDKYETLILGLSLLTTQVPTFIHNLMSEISRLEGKVLRVAGGPHATGDPIGTLNLGFDIVFLGESENTLVEFLRRISEGDDYLKTPGIAYLDEGKVVFNVKPKPIDLNMYPPFASKSRLYNPIEITRGCPYSCSYCQTSFIFGGKPRHRSIDNVVKWTKEILDRGMRDLRFITPNALGYGSLDGKSLSLEIVDELLSKLYMLTSKYKGRIFYGTFPSEIRPEFINSESLRVLKKYVSNERIIIGAQSGSERVLKSIRRGHTVDDVVNAVAEALRFGFKVDVDFIFNIPDEKPEDVEETIKVIEKLVGMGARIHAHTYIPLPGTPLWCKPIKPLDERYKAKILKLIGKGLLYGYWKKQEELALEIYKLKSEGYIRGLHKR